MKGKVLNATNSVVAYLLFLYPFTVGSYYLFKGKLGVDNLLSSIGFSNFRLTYDNTYCIISTVSLVLVALLYLTRGYKVNSIDKEKVTSLKNVFLYVIVVILLFAVVNYFSFRFTYNAEVANVFDAVKLTARQFNETYMAFYIIFLGPIFEELVFRKGVFGFFYDLYEGGNKYLRFILPAIFSGILFGAMFGGLFSVTIVFYILNSLILSALYVKTKSILPGIVLHILYLVVLNFQLISILWL